MQSFTVGELKSRFSEILEKVKKGEEIIISYGKKKENIAVIIPYTKHIDSHERNLGLLEGKAQCILHEDFALDEEEMLAS